MNLKKTLLYALAFVAAFVAAAPSYAQTNSSKYAALVVNAETGAILHQRNAKAKRYPASLTKMMTLYLTFDALEKGKLSMNTYLRVSDRAASQPPMSLDLREGEKITVKDAIYSLVVKSANDAAVVLAEGVGGSEWQFARMMTAKARDLGMENTTFMNASGLHNPGQVSTAVDLAKLAIAMQRDFPEYYPIMAQKRFTRKGVRYETHNRVTKNYKGATGGKTGYINASGFNLVTTARRGGTNLVGVVLGGVTGKKRDAQMISLLDNAFARAGSGQSYAAVKPAEQPVPSSKPAPAAKPQQVASLAATPIPAQTVAKPAEASDAPVPVKRPVTMTRKVERIEKTSVKSRKVSDVTPTAKPQQQLTLSQVEKDRIWAIQVGKFRQEQQAIQAVAHAMDIAGSTLSASRVSFTRTGAGGKTHSAKLANLTEQEARSACNAMREQQSSCRVIRLYN